MIYLISFYTLSIISKSIKKNEKNLLKSFNKNVLAVKTLQMLKTIFTTQKYIN